MQWQDHFSIGVPEIDEQHKKLFQIADNLQATHNTNDMYQEMGTGTNYKKYSSF